MVITHEISQQDWQNQLQICETLIQTLSQVPRVLFSDEVHLYISRSVTKQHMRYWSNENPKLIHTRFLYSDKVIVWRAISSKDIIGPYFIEKNHHAVIINSEHYVNITRQFLEPELQQTNLRLARFQQDDATVHTVRNAMAVLRKIFPGPWSPDMATFHGLHARWI